MIEYEKKRVDLLSKIRRGMTTESDLDILEDLVKKNEIIESPSHYTSHDSGLECIDIAQHMNFCRGNILKYIWRAGKKDDELEDLKKAKKYLEFEIARIASKAKSNDD